MSTTRNRARDNFPSVLLTLVSIIQAIALESLWDQVRGRTELYEPTWDALLGWLQVVVSFNVIVLIWLIYVGLVMRVRWTPTIGDSALPFLVGLVQFSMIEMMGPQRLWAWIFVLGLISAFMTILTHGLLKRARLDPDNREMFEKLSPATWRDFLPQIVTVSLAFLAGAWLWYSGDYDWFALIAVMLALFATAHTVYVEIKYWRLTMASHEQAN